MTSLLGMAFPTKCEDSDSTYADSQKTKRKAKEFESQYAESKTSTEVKRVLKFKFCP